MYKKFPESGRRRTARQVSLAKKLTQCLGIASLLLVTNYGQFLGGGSAARMHTPFPLTAICMAQIVDLLIVTMLLYALLAGLRRAAFYKWARLVLAVLLPAYVLVRGRTLIPENEFYWTAIGLLGVWTGALLLMLWRTPIWYRKTMQAASALCAFFALFGILSMLQLLWVATWKPAPHDYTAVWETTAQPPREHPRVVWIVFDELSYAQVYEHRAQGLSLPNFDALAQESTVFTKVQPAGFKTEKILPSLLSGVPVDDVRYSMGNRFTVHHEGVRGWQTLTGSGTIFGDAHKSGWRTAVVGWYNPYCSTYSDALDDCYWMDKDGFDGPMSPGVSFLQNVYTPLRQMLRELEGGQNANDALCTYEVRNRYKTEMDLQARSMRMLKTDQADLMLIHLGVPHSPNIWSRKQNAYTQTCGSSYLDNLALADRLLGEMVTILKASPRWQNTTVVVQGDHSWRTEIWDGLPAWTKEDDQAAKDGFDPRPALVIHRAGQTSGKLVANAWSLIQIHAVLEEIVRGNPIQY